MKTVISSLVIMASLTPGIYSQDGPEYHRFERIEARVVGDTVVINYDVFGDKPGGLFRVSVYTSADDYSRPLEKVLGDVGPGQTSGSNKTIYWLAKEELAEYTGTVQFRLEISGSFSPKDKYSDSSTPHLKFPRLLKRIQSGTDDGDLAVLEKFLRKNPDHAAAHFLMAEQIGSADNVEAKFHYEAALNKYPTSPKVLKDQKWTQIQAELKVPVIPYINKQLEEFEGQKQQYLAELPESNFTYGNRHALVIGNGSYKVSPLRNAVNDGNDIAEHLEELGFSVNLVTDADLSTMRASIRQLREDLVANPGVAMFYFAGHGIQYNGKNFLVPVNAEIQQAYEIEDDCLRADQILRMLNAMKNPMNIIVLDACRNNPYVSDTRSGIRGLALPDNAPIGTVIAFSTAPGRVAADGSGRNGLYTQELLKALQTPGLTIEQVFKQVRVEVAKKSAEQQIPWENSSLVGEFYFNPKR